ncbi:D-hexose-6-phosphate mutarotase [Rheinheimera baltica]|uniref:D-hexose-6-phosphate mutarotase n=1 Tax=Rheinheimera baltica TaxID=67576 RepID=UPI00056342E3|nr:hypothetical protein [Rheinheimera baltica]
MVNERISHQIGFNHLCDLPCIKLQFGNASAVISLYGGQVLSYVPKAEEEVLWLSPKATWHNNTPIRGGVPVCWPWFGPAESRLNPMQMSLPNHGVVRTMLWQLTEQRCNNKYTRVVLAVTVNGLPYHSDSVTLQLTVTLSDTLSIDIACADKLLQQVALHSYFNIPKLEQTLVQPLPQHYLDKVSGKTMMGTTTTAEFTSEVDRIYQQPADDIHIISANTRVHIKQHGHDATIVWNPWQDKSRHINDLADNNYLEFVCVETARLQLDTEAPLQLNQTLIACY